MLSIVSSFQTLQEFKKSRYFRVSLGLVPTIEKNGTRVYNDKDKFAKFYNTQYNTTIYGQGNVGDIRFYVDHYIKDSSFAVYTNDLQEFLFKLDALSIKLEDSSRIIKLDSFASFFQSLFNSEVLFEQEKI